MAIEDSSVKVILKIELLSFKQGGTEIEEKIFAHILSFNYDYSYPLLF